MNLNGIEFKEIPLKIKMYHLLPIHIFTWFLDITLNSELNAQKSGSVVQDQNIDQNNVFK